MLQDLLQSSIGKKQIVAVTGLILIGFVLLHLAGNLFIFFGPAAFNLYAKTLNSLRPFLIIYIVEFLLFIIFVTHMYVTALLVLENIQARKKRYAMHHSVTERSWASRIMPYTGTIILFFVVWHIWDFTLTDHEGPRSVMPDGRSLGLYAVVYNAFMNPWHSLGYVIAMMALGYHLTHGIQSFFQTFGFNPTQQSPHIRVISNALGFLIVFAYTMIPVYILIDSMKYRL